ncbi:hypothetical protein A3E10_01080 [Candidatus Roizmanbacteria bacterium RIFCSPHIGHO2_12_FULL_37_23]|nr:MAG: hypothetical protein A3E10_01080 [Candidatus Roizmanbacteria bacterium RIFCSPHIGHO2_12_FULL_37_23]
MKYDTLADDASLKKTSDALGKLGYEVIRVKSRQEALAKIKEIIPDSASVMNGSSVTLEQIGFVEYLKSGKHQWNNLHEGIVAEKDPDKQSALRQKALLSDYYLGSVHALAETGEFVIASNTGSQLPHVVNTSPNLIFVVSTKKIVPDLDSAMKRLHEHVVPMEEKHMMEKYKVGTRANKIVIFRGESAYSKRKIRFILVEEDLGF